MQAISITLFKKFCISHRCGNA